MMQVFVVFVSRFHLVRVCACLSDCGFNQEDGTLTSRVLLTNWSDIFPVLSVCASHFPSHLHE